MDDEYNKNLHVITEQSEDECNMDLGACTTQTKVTHTKHVFLLTYGG